MRVSEYKRSEFHDGDETGEVQDFGIGVPAIDNARKIKEFCALVDLSPKTLFECFLCSFERSCPFNEVEVGEDADDFGETV